MSDNDRNLIILEAVSKFRVIVQQQIALHVKRQRDHIVRLRQRFFTKLSRRLCQHFLVYRRKRLQLEEDVFALAPRRAAQQLRHIYNRKFLNTFCSQIGTKSDEEQTHMLRMDADTFRFLCGKLRTELLPGRTTLTVSAPLTLDMKVTIALHVLGSGTDYRSAGKKFDVHFTTVRKCVYSFCRAMVKTFRESEIRMPTNTDQLDLVMKDFEDFVGIPQVVGIIDCLHLSINLPAKDPMQYINSKGWSSVVLQAVVDRHGRFLDISCKHPGRTKDETVLLESTLYKSMEEQEHPFDQARSIDGKDVHPVLLGDKGYPLLPWLITPYLQCDPSSFESSFNVYVTKARHVIDTTFKRLMRRWKVLDRCLHKDISVVPDIIATCCILHNITERRGVAYRECWDEPRIVEVAVPVQPQWTCGIVSAEGEELRHHLVKYMANNFPSIEDDDD